MPKIDVLSVITSEGMSGCKFVTGLYLSVALPLGYTRPWFPAWYIAATGAAGAIVVRE